MKRVSLAFRTTCIPMILLGFLVSGLSSKTCLAQSASVGEDGTTIPGVVVSLDGGQVSSNLAKVLDLLEASGIAVPSRALTIQVGGSVCQLLMSMGYPPPCDPLIPRVEKLNSRFAGHFDNIPAGESIEVPAIDVTTLWREKSVYRTEDTEEYLNGLKRNWKDVSVNVLPDNDEFMRKFEYSSYRINFSAKDFARAQNAYNQLLNSDIPNMTVSLRGAEASKVNLRSGFDDSGFDGVDEKAVTEACEKGQLWPDLNYVNLADSDPDADAIYREARERGMKGEPALIHLMDSPLAASGNLGPALGAQQVQFDTVQKKDCRWNGSFEKERDHANLLAGIIADQEKTGFLGIWPKVSLSSYDLVKDDPEREEHVMEHLLNGQRPSLDLYLFASDFEVNSGGGPFSSDKARLKTAGASVVPGFTNIIVAAAPTNKDDAVTLNAMTSNFPQTWGDYDSVIIVSSCDDCTRGATRLSPDAAVSSSDVDALKFVHVAAPGGHIVGWVGNSLISATQGGTSEAAAFVAGVVSSMISTYPLVYKKPFFVKYRIQVCSYPIQGYRNGGDDEDYGKLAAGIVDPKVCLFDPTKTWIKVGHAWKSVDFAGWSTKSNFGSGLAPADVLRVVKMPGKSDKDVEWRVYSTRQSVKRVHNASKGLGAIKQWRDVEISTDTKFTTCDGHEYNVLALSDFIKAIDERSPPCQTVSSATGSPTSPRAGPNVSASN